MIHRFADWELDEQRCELRRGRTPVAIEPKVFRLLTHLVRHHDRVVSKTELLASVWRGEHVSESALSWCIKEARKVLGDAGADQRIIRTYQRQGYRFVAAVESRDDANLTPAALFVGRGSELARIAVAVERTRHNRGGVVLLGGEPGIGKTRTAAEATARVTRHGLTVLTGRCYEGEGAPAFWPWIQVVRDYLARTDRNEVRRQFATFAEDIVGIIPELGRDLPASGASDPTLADRFRLFDGMTRALRNVASAAPLVLILDDLHWADESSLLLLQYFVAAITDAPILVIATYRNREVPLDHPLHSTLAALTRAEHHDMMSLEGLSEGEVGELVAARFHVPVAGELVHHLHRDSAGNPFFVSEILHLWETEGTPSEPRYRGVPTSVREAIRRRVSSLGDSSAKVLAAAAVCGRDFDLTSVSTAYQPSAATASGGRRSLLAALDRAVAAGLVESANESPGAYRFCHALVRETLYEDLPPGERAAVHARLGDWLAGQGPTRLSEVAHHYFQSSPLTGVERALEYAIRAGDQARSQLAFEDAIEHYRRALLLMSSGEDSAKQRCEVLLVLGEMEWRAGHLAVAKEAIRAAAALARMLHSVDLLALAALGFGGGFRGFEVGVQDDELVQLLETAQAELGSRRSALHARVLARLAVALYQVPGSLGRREELTRRAVEMAQGIGDVSVHLAALYCRQWALWGPDNLEDRLAAAVEMVRLSATAGDREMALHAARFSALDALEAGDRDTFVRGTASCVALANELRQPYYLWYAGTLQSLAALLRSDLEEAAQLALAAHQLGQQLRSGNVEQTFLAQMVTIRSAQGRGQEVESELRTVIERYPTMVSWRGRLALLLCEAASIEEARVQIEKLTEQDLLQQPRNAMWMIFATSFGEACSCVDERRHAAMLYRLLQPYAERLVVSPGAVCTGSVARTLGKLAAALGDWSSAEQHFEAAVRINQQLAVPHLIAHAQQDFGASLLQRGRRRDRRRALDLLAEAGQCFERLALPDRVRTCEQLSAGAAR